MHETEHQMGTAEPYMPPAPPPKRNPWIERGVIVAIIVVAFVLGAVAGGSAEPAPVAAPSPEVRTVTETVEVTPSSCLDAIDYAEEIFRYAAQGFGAASRGFSAAGRFDVQGILAANADMRASTRRVNSVIPEWRQTRNACRASA